MTDHRPAKLAFAVVRIGIGLLALAALLLAQPAGYELQRSTGAYDWIGLGRVLSIAATPLVVICLGWSTASRLVIAVAAVLLIGYLFFMTGVTYGCHLNLSNCL